MTPEDEAKRIAERIADGSGLDWPADANAASSHDRGVLEALKAIADVASAHRAPTGPADASSLAGTRWGPLTIVSLVARGGFSEVYRAWEPRLQREVALKLLDAPSPETASLPTRAIEEARLLARVRHPNVLTVYGAESVEGRVGIWTEFIDGRTLDALVRERGFLTPDEVVAIGFDLCRALAAVHGAGLLHRDIKAHNVMRETGGRIVLMDFGTGQDLTRVRPREGDLTGTPLYLAPEIFAGGRPSVASDIYALGVLLFYLATGDYPVPGKTLAEVQKAHDSDVHVTVRDRRPDVPKTLAVAIERAISPNPAARFESAAAFEHALANADPRRRARVTTPDLVVCGGGAIDCGDRRVGLVEVVGPCQTHRLSSAGLGALDDIRQPHRRPTVRSNGRGRAGVPAQQLDGTSTSCRVPGSTMRCV